MCISCNSKKIDCWHVTFASKFLLFCMCYQKSKTNIWILISNTNIWECKVEFNITTEIKKNILVKKALISAPEKTALALPDPIHNTCVWQAKKYHLKYTLSGVCGPYGIWTTYCVGVHWSRSVGEVGVSWRMGFVGTLTFSPTAYHYLTK